MRLFWAVELAGDVTAAIDAATAPLRRRWPELRWTDPRGWHLTVAFIGEVDADMVGPLGDAVAAALRPIPAPSSVCLPDRAGTPRGRRGIVWLEVEDPHGGLAAVAEAVRDACAEAGAPAEARRPFRAHLTLARIPRRSVPSPARLAGTVAAAYRGPTVSLTAEEVVLLSSRRGPHGAAYTPQRRVGLQP